MHDYESLITKLGWKWHVTWEKRPSCCNLEVNISQCLVLTGGTRGNFDVIGLPTVVTLDGSRNALLQMFHLVKDSIFQVVYTVTKA